MSTHISRKEKSGAAKIEPNRREVQVERQLKEGRWHTVKSVGSGVGPLGSNPSSATCQLFNSVKLLTLVSSSAKWGDKVSNSQGCTRTRQAELPAQVWGAQ